MTIHIRIFINSLKCTWIRKYDSGPNGPCKCLFDLTSKVYKKYIFNCNYNSNDIIDIKNVFF